MQLSLSHDDLKPLVRELIAELLDQFGADPSRIAYSEAEAAALLGLNSHQLRDARLKGQITGSKLGKSWHYSRADLIAFLERRRTGE